MVKTRYYKCHCCHKKAVFYSKKRGTCICISCLKSFDPAVMMARAKVDYETLMKTIVIDAILEIQLVDKKKRKAKANK